MLKPIILSVIIPCYNNVDYVYECLNSIPSTTDGLIQIIIVNDGSTDNSESEINRFVSTHKNTNIILINQKNQGVSTARNKGIKQARGKYITFLDADDLWTPSFWPSIQPILEKNQPDMVIYNASRFYNDNPHESFPLEISKLTYGFHEIACLTDLSKIFEVNGWFSWCRVYKKELFNELLFPENREYEDLAIIPVITTKIKNIFSVPHSLILYRSRKSSITNKPKDKHVDDVIYAMECLYNIFADSDGSDNSKKMLAQTMQHEYSLLRSINKKSHGYCYFNRNQQKKIKFLLKPFQNNFKLSLKLKAKFIYLYSAIEKIKNI